MSRDGDVEGVNIWQAVALVDESSGEIEEVSGFQHHLQDRLPDLGLIEVCWRGNAKKSRLRVLIWSFKRDSSPQNQRYTFSLLPVVLFINLDCFSELSRFGAISRFLPPL